MEISPIDASSWTVISNNVPKPLYKFQFVGLEGGSSGQVSFYINNNNLSFFDHGIHNGGNLHVIYMTAWSDAITGTLFGGVYNSLVSKGFPISINALYGALVQLIWTSHTSIYGLSISSGNVISTKATSDAYFDSLVSFSYTNKLIISTTFDYNIRIMILYA